MQADSRKGVQNFTWILNDTQEKRDHFSMQHFTM
jgi:hypothetical protein